MMRASTVAGGPCNLIAAYPNCRAHHFMSRGLLMETNSYITQGSCCISPDGNTLVVSSKYDTTVWDLATGQQQLSIEEKFSKATVWVTESDGVSPC